MTISDIQYVTAPKNGWKHLSQPNTQKSILGFTVNNRNWVRESTVVKYKRTDKGFTPYVSIDMGGEYKEFDVKIGKFIKRYKNGSESFEAEIV